MTVEGGDVGSGHRKSLSLVESQQHISKLNNLWTQSVACQDTCVACSAPQCASAFIVSRAERRSRKSRIGRFYYPISVSRQLIADERSRSETGGQMGKQVPESVYPKARCRFSFSSSTTKIRVSAFSRIAFAHHRFDGGSLLYDVHECRSTQLKSRVCNCNAKCNKFPFQTLLCNTVLGSAITTPRAADTDTRYFNCPFS
ncbi:hypothetical protein EVAR_93098_1 [Eumeta japonica]|uniref:Uncharacterized protein n=1 Tax=Eumeta variegata TaxID=151549 RepID=A0A4C1TF82_EUMVA|nr:hypothetical protein EVAR_93098_1 [Eumeta japonica]